MRKLFGEASSFQVLQRLRNPQKNLSTCLAFVTLYTSICVWSGMTGSMALPITAQTSVLGGELYHWKAAKGLFERSLGKSPTSLWSYLWLYCNHLQLRRRIKTVLLLIEHSMITIVSHQSFIVVDRVITFVCAQDIFLKRYLRRLQQCLQLTNCCEPSAPLMSTITEHILGQDGSD